MVGLMILLGCCAELYSVNNNVFPLYLNDLSRMVPGVHHGKGTDSAHVSASNRVITLTLLS